MELNLVSSLFNFLFLSFLFFDIFLFFSFFRLAGSYSQLVEYLLNKCSKVDLRLKWQVKEINWKG